MSHGLTAAGLSDPVRHRACCLVVKITKVWFGCAFKYIHVQAARGYLGLPTGYLIFDASLIQDLEVSLRASWGAAWAASDLAGLRARPPLPFPFWLERNVTRLCSKRCSASEWDRTNQERSAVILLCAGFFSFEVTGLQLHFWEGFTKLWLKQRRLWLG